MGIPFLLLLKQKQKQKQKNKQTNKQTKNRAFLFWGTIFRISTFFSEHNSSLGTPPPKKKTKLTMLVLRAASNVWNSSLCYDLNPLFKDSTFDTTSHIYSNTSVKRHNVCKRHRTFLLTPVSNKLNAPFFSPRYFNRIKIENAFKCIFEETVPKLSAKFGRQDSHKNQDPGSILHFHFIIDRYWTNLPLKCHSYLYHW